MTSREGWYENFFGVTSFSTPRSSRSGRIRGGALFLADAAVLSTTAMCAASTTTRRVDLHLPPPACLRPAVGPVDALVGLGVLEHVRALALPLRLEAGRRRY